MRESVQDQEYSYELEFSGEYSGAANEHETYEAAFSVSV